MHVVMRNVFRMFIVGYEGKRYLRDLCLAGMVVSKVLTQRHESGNCTGVNWPRAECTCRPLMNTALNF
jgi:hypothetical protein